MVSLINYAVNPSVEVDLTGYTAIGVPGSGYTLARTTTTTTSFGTYAARLLFGTSPTQTGAIRYQHSAFNVGDTMSFSLTARASKATTLRLRVSCVDSSGNLIGSAYGNVDVAVTPAGQYRLTADNVTIPAGTVSIYLDTVAPNGVAWASGDWLQVDAVMAVVAPASPAYFDGSTPNTLSDVYTWAATPFQSYSIHTSILPPALTPVIDGSPCPRVQIVFPSLHPLSVSLTVLRTAEGRTMKVRGGVNMAAQFIAALVDFETPFGIPATYTAQQFDANGQFLGNTPAASVVLQVATTWVSQPLSPALAVPAKVLLNSGASQTKPAPGATVWTEGATVGRLVGGQRTGLQQVLVRLRMKTAADAIEFDQMFGSYTSDFPAVLLIRTPPNVPLPAVFFAACPDPKRVQSGVGAMVVFELTADEVSPPAPGLIIPILRRADIDAAFTTRASRAAAYTTRIRRDTDYSKAGLAG